MLVPLTFLLLLLGVVGTASGAITPQPAEREGFLTFGIPCLLLGTLMLT